jgi:hypothetical protein
MNASCSPLRIRVPNLIQAGIQFRDGHRVAWRYSYGPVKTWRRAVGVANKGSDMLPQAYLTWLLADTAGALRGRTASAVTSGQSMMKPRQNKGRRRTRRADLAPGQHGMLRRPVSDGQSQPCNGPRVVR